MFFAECSAFKLYLSTMNPTGRPLGCASLCDCFFSKANRLNKVALDQMLLAVWLSDVSRETAGGGPGSMGRGRLESYACDALLDGSEQRFISFVT